MSVTGLTQLAAKNRNERLRRDGARGNFRELVIAYVS